LKLIKPPAVIIFLFILKSLTDILHPLSKVNEFPDTANLNKKPSNFFAIKFGIVIE